MYRQWFLRALAIAGLMVIASLFLMGLAMADDPADAISRNGFVKIITYENLETGESRREMRRHAGAIIYQNPFDSQYELATAEGLVEVREKYHPAVLTVTRIAPVDRWVALFISSALVFLVMLVLYFHFDYDNYLLARRARTITCPRCGYDRRASLGQGCPECGLGHEIDPLISLMMTGKR